MKSIAQIKSTPYGGRGLFATQFIPKDTLVHVSHAPFASVIYRVFRREVCGHCFAYAFDANRNTWSIKHEAGSGVWFCSEPCRDSWMKEDNIGGLLGSLSAAVDKLAQSIKKGNNDTAHSSGESSPDITREYLDVAWRKAEESPMKTGPSHHVESLDELELDTARFVLSGIVSRYLDDLNQLSTTPTPPTVTNPRPTWNEFLKLQDNEYETFRSRPYMMDSHLRIYAFVRSIIGPVKVLWPYVETSECVRALLSRDEGNAFGMYDMSTSGDSEMLGFGVYVSCSYFNHDCTPNVRKQRIGRAMHFFTTKDINIDEELCINYIDIDDEVIQRRADLLKAWYFDCACLRCEKELLAIRLEGVSL